MRPCPVCEGRPPCPPNEAAWHRVYQALQHRTEQRDEALARVAVLEDELASRLPLVIAVRNEQ